MGFYYLSNPYNGTDTQKQQRADTCAEVCFHLISHGNAVFSPILHNHAMFSNKQVAAQLHSFSANDRHDFIMGFDLMMLANAKAMLLLQLPGWEKSRGVMEEIAFCNKHKIEIIEHNLESIFTVTSFKKSLKTDLVSIKAEPIKQTS